MGWELTLSSYSFSLAPAQLKIKMVQVYSVCQALLHIKMFRSSLSFIIQLWTPWGIPKQIPAGVILGYFQLHGNWELKLRSETI